MRARITKVGQTNIDIFLLDCFCRRVNFWFSNGQDSISGCRTDGPQLMNRQTGQAPLKKTAPRRNQSYANAFLWCRQFQRAISGMLTKGRLPHNNRCEGRSCLCQGQALSRITVTAGGRAGLARGRSEVPASARRALAGDAGGAVAGAGPLALHDRADHRQDFVAEAAT